MKKLGLLSLTLLLVSMLALAGCGNGSENGATGGSGGNAANSGESEGIQWDAETNEYVMEEPIASGEVPLKIWVEYEEYGKALQEAFAKKYPNVKVEYEIVPKVDSVERMALDGEAGKGADVFTTNYDELGNAIDNATAAPVGNYEAALKERISEPFINVVTRDEQMYGVPISTESIALFYNKTLLKELTGSDEPATTWEEISELAQTYNNPATNQWTIRFQAGQIYYAYSVLSSLGWHLYQDGDLDNPNFEAPELKAGLEYYKGLRNIWNVNSADATYDSIENEFIKGKTPYVITGPWVFADFDKAAAENGFEYGVTKLPKVASGEEASSFSGISVAVVSGYTKYPAAARVFLNFMASDEGAAALHQSTGAIPALNEEHLNNVEGIAGNEHIGGIVAQSENADLMPQVPEYLYTSGNSLMVNVWDNLLGVEEAQQKATKEYTEMKALVE
ncbi:extracellular solute-binding protein [Paenibacillus sp. M1]|uniref:Maltodextrin-binding protein n=1 Tax=Paenibacillus haidiansis TaxID=1574488 RepID=A0ABU7VP63_9BACL